MRSSIEVMVSMTSRNVCRQYPRQLWSLQRSVVLQAFDAISRRWTRNANTHTVRTSEATHTPTPTRHHKAHPSATPQLHFDCTGILNERYLVHYRESPCHLPRFQAYPAISPKTLPIRISTYIYEHWIRVWFPKLPLFESC